MLTQLSTVKTRIGLTDTASDTIITSAIAAYSDRFERECNRNFARQINAIDEFDADQTEICPLHYPIESVASFDLKTTETDGWQAITPNHLLRNACVISLQQQPGCRSQQARVTYTGGYVLPGDTIGAGQTALPDDLEQACVEQVAYWFQNRNTLGLLSVTVGSGAHVAQIDLLPGVAEVLTKYTRMTFDQ
jgi:hypothetical protein